MTTPEDVSARPRRADAVRNTETVLEAAKTVFAESGVDAPMRDIAARAEVGVGTIYRNYPLRSDLIIAVFRREVEAVATEADRLADELSPPAALRDWSDRLNGFVATKRGLAKALHSGDPAYEPLPRFLLGTLAPPVQRIIDAGVLDGSFRTGVDAEDLILALLRLADSHPQDATGGGQRMIGLLIDGLTATGE